MTPPDEAVHVCQSYALAQQCCLDNARVWLDAADAILASTTGSDAERAASVLFAHAVREIGKAVDLFRAERLVEDFPRAVLFDGNDRGRIESAREVLGDELSITPDARDGDGAVGDLIDRLAAFAVHVSWEHEDPTWTPPTKVDGQRLREHIWTTQDKVSLAMSLGVQAILRPLDEFAPAPKEPIWSSDRVVNAACAIQQRRMVERVSRRRRGPAPLRFTPAGLEWIARVRPAFAVLVKKFARIWLRGDLLPSERRGAAERELVRRFFPSLPNPEARTLAAALVKRGKRPRDMVDALIAKKLAISDSAARKAARLLTDARHVVRSRGVQ